MNCKTKALIVGFGWGVGFIVAVTAGFAILGGLFMLGDTIGINIAAIVAISGAGVVIAIVAKAGYDQYLEKCKEN